ncbi:MAG: sensor domain-containing diguanylate cyclase [bacterium]|nr:MAG: sensor domain-containing diguanylate cyclase [bacterium]
MNSGIRWPWPSVILIILFILSGGFLFFPSPVDGLSWYPVHLLTAAAVLGLTLFVPVGRRGARERLAALPFQSAVLVVSAAAVKILLDRIPLVPLVFFLAFPFSVFASRLSLFWIPGAVLGAMATGLWIFQANPYLAQWASAFALFSLALTLAMAGRSDRYDSLRRRYDRILADARDMGRRISELDLDTAGLEFLSQRERMKTSAVLEEDELLQRSMELGRHLLNATAAILLVPENSGMYRVRAATVSRSYSGRVTNEPIPGDSGIISLARERGGHLVVNDIRPGSPIVPLYNDTVPVRSLMVKIPRSDPSGDGRHPDHILYFDSLHQDAFPDDPVLEARLNIFCGFLSQIMKRDSLLKKVTWEVRSKAAISRYAQSLTRTLDPEEIARGAVKAIQKAVPRCEGAAFLLNDDRVVVVCARGDALQSLQGSVIQRTESSQIGLLLKVGREIILGSRRTKQSPYFHANENLGRIASFAAVPSHINEEGEDRLFAVLVGVSSHEEVFDRESVSDIRAIADITAQALANALKHRKIEELSRTDGLTGLLNHRTFQEVLASRIERVGREYERSLAVVMVDVDHFKEVNDVYGHPVGDEVLRELAGLLKTGVRELDAVARYGGEEFALVLDNVDDRMARKITEKLKQAVDRHEFRTAAGSLHLTVSMGYAVLTQGDTVSKQEILDMADRALYSAKRGGRNRTVDYRDLKGSSAPMARP